MTGEEKIGTATDYYAKIGVAAIRLDGGSLAVGDTIRVRGHSLAPVVTNNILQPRLCA